MAVTRRAASPAPADALMRLAVLLQAGLPPARAWAHLADAGDEVALRVRGELDRGTPLSDAVAAAAPRPAPARSGPRRRDDSAAAWADVGAAWRVATVVGAPLAESLRGLAAALRDAHEVADEVGVALAEPAATARLMAWLPLVAVVLGALLGFDIVGTLIMSPSGLACLAAGLVLIVAARGWTRSLVRRAAGERVIAGLDAELLAVALSGGCSIDRARDVVARATGGRPTADTEGVLALSHAAGAPAVELLRASAALARHRARIDGRLRAAALSSRLLLPLGVCTLPAFLLLGVAPMLLSVLSTIPSSF